MRTGLGLAFATDLRHLSCETGLNGSDNLLSGFTRVWPFLHFRRTWQPTWCVCQGKMLLEQQPPATPTPLLEVEQGCEPALFLALFSYMLPPLAAVVLQGGDETPDLRQGWIRAAVGAVHTGRVRIIKRSNMFGQSPLAI